MLSSASFALHETDPDVDEEEARLEEAEQDEDGLTIVSGGAMLEVRLGDSGWRGAEEAESMAMTGRA